MNSLIREIQHLETRIEADREQLKKSRAQIRQALEANLGRPRTVLFAFGGGMALGWLYRRRLRERKPDLQKVAPYVLPIWEWWWRQ
ncbi:MAG: hypothetical protein D6819_03420 [Gammaproteobacteria bacterium]|nr:MAG: hypothetical protein D6819_03420 [Gammaproteobacteria bacterium]